MMTSPVDQLQETQRVASKPLQRGHHQDVSGPDNIHSHVPAARTAGCWCGHLFGSGLSSRIPGSHTYICGLPLSRYEWAALEIWPASSRWVADFEPHSATGNAAASTRVQRASVSIALLPSDRDNSPGHEWPQLRNAGSATSLGQSAPGGSTNTPRKATQPTSERTFTHRQRDAGAGQSLARHPEPSNHPPPVRTHSPYLAICPLNRVDSPIMMNSPQTPFWRPPTPTSCWNAQTSPDGSCRSYPVHARWERPPWCSRSWSVAVGPTITPPPIPRCFRHQSGSPNSGTRPGLSPGKAAARSSSWTRSRRSRAGPRR